MINPYPEVWSDLVFASDDVESDLRAIAHGGQADDILLYGPYGSGKTMIAETLVASRAERKRSDVEMWRYEPEHWKPIPLIDSLLKGSSLITTAMEHQNAKTVYLIIDEVDSWKVEEQVRLALYMDSQFRSVRLILTTNSLSSVIGKVADRCITIPVEYPPYSRWNKRARQLLGSVGINVTDDELEGILFPLGNGMSARRVTERLNRFASTRAK